ncbi:MAG TPA: hypothetical protein VF191_06125 [Cyclobacteriaceae bacterium]
MRTLRYPALTLYMVIFVYSFVRGQPYVKVGAGYGFPLASEQLGTGGRQEFTTTLDPQSGFEVPRLFTENESVHGSYGAGLLADCSFGYMFADQLGVEAMFSYVMGREYGVINTGLDSRLGQVLYDSRATVLTKSKGFFFAPMLKLAAGSGRLQPYLMAGPILGKVYFDRSQDIITFEQGITTSEGISARYRGGLARGARGIAGVELVLKSSMRFFAEAVITGMNYYPRKGEVTRYEINGTNSLSILTTRQRQANFVDKVTTDSDEPMSTDENPGQLTRFSVPLSSIAANAGIKYTFGH